MQRKIYTYNDNMLRFNETTDIKETSKDEKTMKRACNKMRQLVSVSFDNYAYLVLSKGKEKVISNREIRNEEAWKIFREKFQTVANSSDKVDTKTVIYYLKL